MFSVRSAMAGLLLASSPVALADTMAVGPAEVPLVAVGWVAAGPVGGPAVDAGSMLAPMADGDAAAVPVAAAVAPAEMVPEEPRPVFNLSGGSDMWPKCDFFSGNESHTLFGIMDIEWTRKFGPSNFSRILELVDEPTMKILREFDINKPGHTLMVPLNEGKNFTDKKLRDVNTFQQFGIDPSTMTTAAATQIVRNHLINETITYSSLQSITGLGNTARYQSLGYVIWEFIDVNGGIKLVDTYNIGQDRTKGVLFIQADITVAKQGECPNSVFSVDGFIATPTTVPPPVPPPPPPPPPVAPPPAIVRSSPDFDNPFASPIPPAAPSPPPAVDETVSEESTAVLPCGGGAAAILSGLLAAAALFAA